MSRWACTYNNLAVTDRGDDSHQGNAQLVQLVHWDVIGCINSIFEEKEITIKLDWI